MSQEKDKTHYRKVFKSDHLGVADLEEYLETGVKLNFTVSEVRQEYGIPVAGRRGDYNIAYFKEGIKPLVLNATNSKIMRSFNNNSPFVEDWSNTFIELYIDNTVKMKGEVVGGVRIREIQPKKEAAKPLFTEKNFEKAKKANATLEKIKSIYNISEVMQAKYLKYVAEN